MPLNFITGAPGSGKTAVTNEITSRGYQIYDTDDPTHTGIAGWYDLATGEYVAGFNEREVTPALLDTHIWKLSDAAFENFKNKSELELIYLCGRLRDPGPIIEATRHIVFLAVEEGTIADRLEKRGKIPGEVNWGREPWQVKRSIVINRELEAQYRSLGAIMINADRPLPEVVDNIISETA